MERRTPIYIRLLAGGSLAVVITMTGCKSTGSKSSSNSRSYNWAKLDAKLPSGSTSTPSHRLPRYEYPFDSRGNYVSSWAAEGERRRGGGSAYAIASSKPSYTKPSYTKPTSTYTKPTTSYTKPTSTYTKPTTTAYLKPQPKPTPKPSYRYHTVAAGDTLFSLSRRYGTSVSRIKSLNGLSSDLIVNGRRLKVP